MLHLVCKINDAFSFFSQVSFRNSSICLCMYVARQFEYLDEQLLLVVKKKLAAVALFYQITKIVLPVWILTWVVKENKVAKYLQTPCSKL